MAAKYSKVEVSWTFRGVPHNDRNRGTVELTDDELLQFKAFIKERFKEDASFNFDVHGTILRGSDLSSVTFRVIEQ